MQKNDNREKTGAGRQEASLPHRYEKPSVMRIDLALEETMSKGCKLGDDSVCVGPPITAYDAGS